MKGIDQDYLRKYVKSRARTLRYEVSKTIAECPSKISDEEKKLRNSILKLNGNCEYCEVHESSCKDDYLPLIKKKNQLNIVTTRGTSFFVAKNAIAQKRENF